jgi:selenocysteine-specific elongation factor
VEAVETALIAGVDEAGPLGLDVAKLDERERAVLGSMSTLVVTAGRVRPAGAADPLVDHPLLAVLRAGGLAPPEVGDRDRAAARALVRRGLVVERDGAFFAPTALDAAADLAASLLREQPEGFTVSRFREAAGITRKHALPLLNELDARAITRRRGDVRIGGPRLPQP